MIVTALMYMTTTGGTPVSERPIHSKGTQMEHSIKRTLAVSATTLALLTGGGLLAGCGSDSSASGTTATAADTTAQASNGVEKLSGQEIVTKSQAAANSASSVTVAGSVAMNGDNVGLDLALGDTAATGSITMNGMTIQIRVVDGTTYIKLDPKDLAKVVSANASGAVADQIQSVVGNKWLKVPADPSNDQLAALGQFGSKDGLIKQILTPQGDVTVTGTGDVNGTPVVNLDSSKGTGTLSVQTVGEPYPVRIAGAKGSNSGHIDFSNWNGPVDVTAPTDILDISALGG